MISGKPCVSGFPFLNLTISHGRTQGRTAVHSHKLTQPNKADRQQAGTRHFRPYSRDAGGADQSQGSRLHQIRHISPTCGGWYRSVPCYLEMSQKVAQKKDCCPDAETQRKAEQKKQTSRIADNPRKSELKKSSPAARLRKMRESAHKKRACCLFRDFRGPKRRCVPRSGRHPGRSGGLDVELLQKVAQKKLIPAAGGAPKGPPRFRRFLKSCKSVQ